jgi:hypothetical protein
MSAEVASPLVADGESAQFRHEADHHACAVRGYAGSGWWAGVPQQEARP